MTRKKKPATVADAQKMADEALKNALASFDAEANIRAALDQIATDVIARTLGFRNDWGRWEVDHCNGRMSEINKLLTEKGVAAAREWFAEHATDLAKMPRGTITAMKNDYQEILTEQVSRLLRARAEQDAQRIVNDIIANANAERAE